MVKEANRVFFPGLDGLRAIGAISVALSHIELSKKSAGLPNILDLAFYKNTGGHLGVMLFFVLSGFLITYLLLQEKEKYNSISIKNFYIRRVLRIWPIYYLIVISLIFVWPNVISLNYFAKPDLSNWKETLPTALVYFFMLPNLVCFGVNSLGGGSHLSSIGTEEQFYIIWPWLIRMFKNILIPFFIILIGIPVIPHAADYMATHFLKDNAAAYLFMRQLGEFFMFFKINCMALGGFFAWAFFQKKQTLLKFIYSKAVQILSLCIGIGGWVLGFYAPVFNDEFYSFFFAIIIINTATNPSAILSFNYPFLNYIGKISYGIFVYHWVIIYLVMDILKSFVNSPTIYNTLLYLAALILTVVVSHLSFYYFESYFLKFKDKFARIKSYSTT